MRLLIVNPNITAAITEMLLAEGRRAMREGTEIQALTVPFGVSAIETAADATVAGHAVLQAFAGLDKPIDAGIIGGYVDPGLDAARELMRFPVVGIGESSMLTACLLGVRFGILTAGFKTISSIRALVDRYGLTSRLACIRSTDVPLLEIAKDQATYDDEYVRIARKAIEEDGANAIILGGAIFVGMAHRIQNQIKIPVLDPIHCAVLLAENLVRISAGRSQGRADKRNSGKVTSGLSDSLAAILGTHRSDK